MKLGHQLTPYTKINSRCIKDLNISHDTIKVLEEKHRQENLRYPMQQYFQHFKRNLSYIKLESFYTAKENINKMERKPTVCKSIFANETSDKDLISKIYKELT